MTIRQIKLPNTLVYPVTVDEVHVRHGQKVLKGDPIYTLADQSGQLGRITAPYDGVIDGEPAARHTVFDLPQVVIGIRPAKDTADVTNPDPTARFADPTDPSLFEPWRDLAPLASAVPPEPAPAADERTVASAPAPQPRKPAPPGQSRPQPVAQPPQKRRGPLVALVGVLAFVGVVSAAVTLFAPDRAERLWAGLFGDGRADVDPNAEAPVAAALERHLLAFRDNGNFGLQDARVDRGTLFITVAHQGASSTERSIHIEDIQLIELKLRPGYYEVDGSLTIALRCAVANCVNTLRATDDPTAVTRAGFRLDDNILNFRLYHPSDTPLDDLYKPIRDMFDLADLYGNTNLEWKEDLD